MDSTHMPPKQRPGTPTQQLSINQKQAQQQINNRNNDVSINVESEYFTQHAVNVKPPFNFVSQPRPQSPQPINHNNYLTSPYATPQFQPSSPNKQSIQNSMSVNGNKLNINNNNINNNNNNNINNNAMYESYHDHDRNYRPSHGSKRKLQLVSSQIDRKVNNSIRFRPYQSP